MILFKLMDFSEKQLSRALSSMSNVELLGKIQKLGEEVYTWHKDGVPISSPKLLSIKCAKLELMTLLEQEYKARNKQTTPFRMGTTEHGRGDNVVKVK